MPHLTVGSENNAPIEIHYNDHGSGRPIVLIHGYPLDGNSWERQERQLLANGYRVITYDRRGFGRSSQPVVGYDYDTFAGDLQALIEHLDLNDVVLCGFSMGTGEVVRYLGTHGSARVRKAVLLGAIPPFVLKTDDNPDGVDGKVFDDIKSAIVSDRYAFFEGFLNNFHNVDVLSGTRISDRAWQASFNVAVGSAPFASSACVDTWLTDFRADLARIDVPVLVMHGTEDRILPFEVTAARLPALIADCTLVPVEGGPHNIAWTYPDEVNAALLTFLSESRSNDETLMEFLVEFQLEIPDGVPDSEVKVRQRSEAAAADALADHGHLVRLWRTFLSTGPVTILGLYRADSHAELNELLAELPLYEWMRTSVTPLSQHPNDPGKRAHA